MPPRLTLRAPVGSLSIAALVLSWALVPASASPAATRPSDGDLSSRLAALAKPAVRSLPAAKQAKVLSLARRGPGSLLRDGNRLLVDVRFERGAAAGVDELRDAGGKIVNVSRRYQTVTVAAKPADLRDLAAVSGVEGVTEILAPIARAAECPSGTTVSEGDVQLRAAEAREAFEVDGSGVTVGVLSDSFDVATQAADGSGTVATRAADDVAAGDLPGPGNPCEYTTPVTVLEEIEEPDEGADEGRAMAQIVHDLAPGAELAFASAFNGELAFAENIEWLAEPVSEGGGGAQVIVDDVIYLDEPFFQDGPVAVAANNVATGGAAFFSAAGNDNLIDEEGNDIASWEAPAFRSSLSPSSCPAGLVSKVGLANAADCMDFDPAAGIDNAFGITVEEGATLTVDLQWAEPWFGVEADLDVFLLDAAGEPVEFEFGGESFLVGSADDNVSGSLKPFEFFQWENGGPEQVVQIAINRCSAICNPSASPVAAPRVKFVLMQNGGGVSATEYPKSAAGDTVGPTIFGHSGAAGAISVGAVPFFDDSEPEYYSSRGPVTHYLGPVNGVTPAEPLPSPELLSKPDLAATDCGVTSFFAFFVSAEAAWRFCGTSAAAPHAAGVAALMLEASPVATPAAIRSGMADTARPVGLFESNSVGAGLVDAMGAVSSVYSPPPPEEEGTEEGEEEGGGANPPLSEIKAANPPADDSGPVVQDRLAPKVFFRKRPAKVVRTRQRKAKVVFRVGSNEEGVTFTCRVDGKPFRSCQSRFARELAVGRHVIRVMATDSAGNIGTPAVYRFRVKRVG